MKKKMIAGLMTLAMVGAFAAPITVQAEDTWVSAGSGSFSTSSDGTITYTVNSSSSSSSEAYTSSGQEVDWSTITIKGLEGVHGIAGSIDGLSLSWSIEQFDNSNLPTGLTEETIKTTKLSDL